MPASLTLSPSIARRCGVYSTSLEPSSLVDAFMQHPPERFSTAWIEAGQHAIPGFYCRFDLRTTLDDGNNRFVDWLRSSSLVGYFTRFRTLFIGTTVSEYALVPSAEKFDSLLHSTRSATRSSQLLIIKDIPQNSPLLSEHANQRAGRLLDAARDAGFIIVEGQALAYVPIDFSTLDDYFAKLSYSRRKEFRRKLKSRADITIEQLQTGSSEFSNESLLDDIYELYLNVFAQSKYNFDKLSKGFFRDVLTRRDSGGIVFLYRKGKQLIGFNLCFLHNGMLIDKYIGMRYPEARQSNLYFVSWFTNLDFAMRNRLTHYVAGWTDPEVKKALGASFTFTKHAVYIPNPVLRTILKPLRRHFEPDSNWAQQTSTTK